MPLDASHDPPGALGADVQIPFKHIPVIVTVTFVVAGSAAPMDNLISHPFPVRREHARSGNTYTVPFTISGYQQSQPISLYPLGHPEVASKLNLSHIPPSQLSHAVSLRRKAISAQQHTRRALRVRI